jgi:uncharacterized protein YecE (DUF72 family)
VLDPLAGENLLGAVVIQLPEDLAPTPQAIATLQEAIVALAERRIAIDARDARWLDHGVPVEAAAPLFASRDVTLVERPGISGAHVPPVDASHAYLRLEGKGGEAHLFGREELAPWAIRAQDLDARGKEVRVTFTNTALARGTRDALLFRAMVGQRSAPLPKLTEQRKLSFAGAGG